MLTLYHGSNVKVAMPQILPAKRLLDFGQGFYLTSDLQQAQKWALRKTQFDSKSSAIVSVFNVTEDDFNKLSVLRFPSANPQLAALRCCK